MAGAQQIGTGAVVLTANADQMLHGLNKAQKGVEKWATTTTAKAASAGGASGGGLLQGLLFGGAVGAGIGLALSGLRAIQSAVMGISDVGERSKKYSNVGTDQQGKIDRADAAFSRMSAAGDEFLFKIMETLAPALERLAGVLEKVGFVGGEAFNAVADGAGEANPAATETFDIMREIGKALKFIGNAGDLMAITLLDAFAAITRGAADVLDAFGMTESGKDARAFAQHLEGISQIMTDDLAKEINKFDEAFDKIKDKFENTERLAKKFGKTLSGAFGQGSTEAYSVMAQFNAGNLITGQAALADNPVAIQKQQLKEAREIKKATFRWVDAVGKMIVVTPTDL